MNRIFYILIIVSTFINAASFEFSDIPIQENGRIKPIDTFAKNQLLSIYAKRSLKSEEMSAVEWIIDLLSNLQEMKDQKYFVSSKLFLVLFVILKTAND